MSHAPVDNHIYRLSLLGLTEYHPPSLDEKQATELDQAGFDISHQQV